ncbi:TonB-dependent siderophore receptor [Bradyrhizobium prioriisuperbiae]|uniref:TonB-dependent siderophore receptor n=1 Tax=Bradyrhizobium prioriisuperbiae TaxID=2854389 RepID=UPI0028E53558|nr:TonB-dependent siderophore receptor [Bradyrhizobium prioritasuperba]
MRCPSFEKFLLSTMLAGVGLGFSLGFCLTSSPALAQAAAPSGRSLPAVTVDAPQQRRVQARPAAGRAASSRAARRATAARQAAQQAAQSATSQEKSRIESGNGPINGYVAGRSLAGTKTNTPILETPQAISVVGRSQLQDQGSQSIVEALRYTAGVSGNSNPNDNRFETIRVRGFEPLLYLDGMQLPVGTQGFGRTKVDPWILERVEVLKGPSSSLYGAVAPGGLINLVSLLPTATPTHTVEMQANNYGRMQGAFDLGGPIDPRGEFLYRVTGAVHGGGTSFDYIDDFRGVIAPSFTWKPNLDTTFTVLGAYQRDVSGVTIQFLPANGTLRPNPFGTVPISKNVGEPGWDSYKRSQYWAGYQFEHHASDVWTVRQNLRYAGLDTDVQAVIGQGGLMADNRTLRRFAFIVPENSTAFTMDNQAEARFNTGSLAHVALFGVDYRHTTSDFSQYFGSAPSIDLFNTVYGQPFTLPPLTTKTRQVQDQVGVYAQDQIALGGWRLTLSGRHDWVTTDSTDFLKNTLQSQDNKAFSGRAGLNYVFDSGVSPYVAYARSFQPTVGLAWVGTPFVPTTGEQYEVGIKYQPVGTNVMVTAALFDITQQNVLTVDPAHVGFSLQTGEARSRGLELEATASLTNGLKMIASYTYTDTETTKSTTLANVGKQLINVPRNQAALWGDYTFQDGKAAGFGFGAGVRYIGTSNGDAANTLLIPDYTLVDAAVHYDLSNLDPKLRGTRVAINVNNLFNKEYVSTCQSINACFYGSDRMVTGSLRYTW